MSGIEQELRLRINADNSGLSATFRASKGDVSSFSAAVDEANQTIVEGSAKAAESFSSVSEAAKAAGSQAAAGAKAAIDGVNQSAASASAKTKESLDATATAAKAAGEQAAAGVKTTVESASQAVAATAAKTKESLDTTATAAKAAGEQTAAGFKTALDGASQSASTAATKTKESLDATGTAAKAAGEQAAAGLKTAMDGASQSTATATTKTTQNLDAVGAAGKVAGEQAAAGFKTAVEGANQATSAATAKTKQGFEAIGSAGKAAGDQAAAGIDRMGSSATAFMSQSRGVQAMLASEAKSLADVATRREVYAAALKNGLISQAEFTAGSKALNSQQAALEKQLGNTAKGATGAAGAVSHLGIQSAGAQREIGVLIGELARGNFAAFEKSLITLARQTGLLTTGFRLLLGPIGLIAGIAAIAIAAFVSLEAEQSRLNKAIISTGNYAGVTVAQVQQLGATVGAQTGKISETRQALDLLVASGKFTGSQLALVGKGVVDFATVTGTSVEKAVDSFKKLADDPVKASIALNDQYHFLTLSIYDQIAAAEKNGNTQQAAAIAEKALAEEFGRRAKTMEDSLGTVERAWKGVTSAAKGAWDAILDIGRPKSPDEQLKAARSKVNEASNFLEEILAGKIGYAPDSFINARKADLQSAIDAEAKLYASFHKTGQAAEDQSAALAGIHQQEQDAAIKARADFDKLNATFDKTAAAQEKINKAAADLYKIYIGGGKLPEGVRFDGPVADVPVGPGWDKLKAKILEASGAFKGLSQESKSFADGQKRISEIQIEAAGETAAAGKALAEYKDQQLFIAKNLAQAADLYAKGKLKQDEYTAAVKNDTLAQQAAYVIYQRKTAAIVDQTEKQLRLHDVVGNYLRKLDEDKALAAMTDREYAVTKALTEQIDAWNRLKESEKAAQEAAGHANPTKAEGARLIRDETAAAYDYVHAMAYLRQGAQEVEHTIAGGFSNAFSAVGQLLTGQIRSFKDFWGSVVSGFKNMFAQIIASSLQMRLLGPIMQSFGFNGANYGYLGGGASLLGSTPALVQTGSALAASGAIPGGGAYTLGNAGSTGLQGLGDLFSPSQWFGLGKSLFSGFSSLWGGSAFNPASANFVGPPVAGQTFGPQFGGYSSAFQQILGVLGGAYAGINRAQNADGAFGKIGGGLSYGLGTYALGAGLSSLAAGTGFAAGVSGAFSAIPVAGWVALGAMVLDKISGGNLFGTSWNPTGNSRSNLSVTAAGASFQNEYEEKKKKALFGGNTYKWVGTDTTDEQKQWLDQFTAAMKQVRESASAVLGNTIADTVTGAFSQKFDKDGKVTEQISTVLGKTYKESIDAFAKRMQAENVFAQIDAALGTKEASGIAEQYRKNADQLSEAAKMLLQAQVDVKHGMSLLGESTSLTQINAVVSQLAASGETLIDAYTRLQSETQTFRSALDIIGVSIDKTGADFVRFADAAATAAGGVDKFKALLDGFQSAFYSTSELAKAQAAAYRKQSDSALTGLGLDPSISMSDFRAKFEAALPKLTPEQLATWLTAANYLAQATNAEKAYGDQVKQNAETIRSVLASLNPAGDPLAGTWTQTLASINATFDQAIDKLKAAGATVDQLALAEAYRPEAIAKAQKAAQDNYASLVSQIRKGIDELNTPATDLQKALDGIAQAEKDTIDQLNAAARAANMQSASEADLAAAHLYAAMQADAARKAAAEAQKKAYQDYASVAAGLGAELLDTLHPASAFQQQLRDIASQLNDNIDKLNAAARAAGMQAAREQDLALAHQLAAAKAAVAAHTLELGAKDLVSQLYGSGDLGRTASAAGAGLQSVAQGLQSIQQAVNAFRNSMLLDSSLSPLNTQQQYDEALKQLAQTGDEGTARTALELARKLMATGADYTDAFNQITGMVRPKADTSGDTGAGSSVGGTQLTDLQRSQLAQQLAQNVADLAGFSGENFADIAKRLGFSLTDLSRDLGLQGKSVEDFLKSLQSQTYSLADLSSVLSKEVDRIVAAIQRSYNMNNEPVTVDKNKPTPIEAKGPSLDSSADAGAKRLGATYEAMPSTIASTVTLELARISTANQDALRESIGQINDARTSRELPVPLPVAFPRMEELQQKLIDGQSQQTQTLVNAMIDLIKVVASGASSNDDGQAKLLDAFKDMERTLRGAADKSRSQPSDRTSPHVVFQS